MMMNRILLLSIMSFAMALSSFAQDCCRPGMVHVFKNLENSPEIKRALIDMKRVLTPIETESIFLDSKYDSLRISVVIVRPEGDPIAVLQIAHGMCGSKERFLPFMEFMAANGVACIANDHRGHGESVKSDDDLGFMYSGGHVAVVEDLRMVSYMAKNLFPDKPFFLLGHSMGSLATRAYVREDDGELDGLLICGSPAYNPLCSFGIAFTGTASRLGLSHSRPKLLQWMVSSNYNRRFRSEGPQSWTCSDPEVRRSFQSNPKNNFKFTVNGSNCLMNLMKLAYDHDGWAMKSPALPVLFLSGEDDPCPGGRKGLDRALKVMEEAGYVNLDMKTYPSMRHEILNEIGKETVWSDILAFIRR